MANRGQIGWDTLVPWIIGFVVLVLVVIFYGILKTKGGGGLDFLRNLFRFG